MNFNGDPYFFISTSAKACSDEVVVLFTDFDTDLQTFAK